MGRLGDILGRRRILLVATALFGVGFIVGPTVSAVLFAGALFGHLFLAPLAAEDDA